MLIAMMANTYQNVSKTVISYVRNSDMHQDYLLTFKGILTSGFEVGQRDIPSPVHWAVSFSNALLLFIESCSKNRSAMPTCGLVLSFIPFDRSLFLKVSIWELKLSSVRRLTAKVETVDTVIVVEGNSPRNVMAPRSNGEEILRFYHVLKLSRPSMTFWDYAQKLNSYFVRVCFDSWNYSKSCNKRTVHFNSVSWIKIWSFVFRRFLTVQKKNGEDR